MKKIIDVTPKKHACALGECPAVLKTDAQTYIIIGKVHDVKHPALMGRVGHDEMAVEISADLLEAAVASQIREQ